MLDSQKQRTSLWFQELQERLIATIESLEQTYCQAKGLSFSGFKKRPWHRRASDEQATTESRLDTSQDSDGGGGISALMQGHLFEKAGINFSCVHGVFSPEFAQHIPGANEHPAFWASGVSLVMHPFSPHLPTVHMNTRYIVTQQSWFGGGADLTPIFPDVQDTKDFHLALQTCCDRHDPMYYPKFKSWADTYFFLPHRNESRGVGGIFYDNLNSGSFEFDFSFTQDVGLTFEEIYVKLINRHKDQTWTEAERIQQLIKRGRYVEFNLLYDRGTLFGLKTGGHTESILMSLPPHAMWT